MDQPTEPQQSPETTAVQDAQYAVAADSEQEVSCWFPFDGTLYFKIWSHSQCTNSKPVTCTKSEIKNKVTCVSTEQILCILLNFECLHLLGFVVWIGIDVDEYRWISIISIPFPTDFRMHSLFIFHLCSRRTLCVSINWMDRISHSVSTWNIKWWISKNDCILSVIERVSDYIQWMIFLSVSVMSAVSCFCIFCNWRFGWWLGARTVYILFIFLYFLCLRVFWVIDDCGRNEMECDIISDAKWLSEDDIWCQLEWYKSGLWTHWVDGREWKIYILNAQKWKRIEWIGIYRFNKKVREMDHITLLWNSLKFYRILVFAFVH